MILVNALFLIFAILLFIFVANELWGWSTLSVIAGLTLIYYKVPALWLFITADPINLIIFLVIYLGIGIIYSFVKWYFYLLNKRDEISVEEVKISKQRYGTDEYVIPRAKQNISRISAWIGYWPVSAILTLINDPIRRFFRMIARKLSAVFDKITDHVFKDLK